MHIECSTNNTFSVVMLDYFDDDDSVRLGAKQCFHEIDRWIQIRRDLRQPMKKRGEVMGPHAVIAWMDYCLASVC